MAKKISVLFLILFASYVWTLPVKADSLGDYLKESYFVLIYPFREKLEVGTICKRTGTDVDIIASKKDCVPGLVTESSKLKYPLKIISSSGALDFVAGLSKDIVKTDLEAALKLAASKEIYMEDMVLETEMVPSRLQLVKHLADMTEGSCYGYLSDNEVIFIVAKTKGFTFTFKGAKSGGLDIILSAFAKAGIKGKKEGTEIIRLESESPWCIAYKAYNGKELKKEIERRKEELKREEQTVSRDKGVPRAPYSPKAPLPVPAGLPSQEIEQDETSLRHFDLWK